MPQVKLVAERLPAAVDLSASVTVDVAEDSGEFTQDGGRMWRIGYALLDAAGRYLRKDSTHLSDPRCLGFNVAGTSLRRDTLQDPSFSVLSPLVLRPEPENAHDPNAVGVWDASGTLKIGFVPRRLSAIVAERFRAGIPLGAVITSEYRLGSPAGERAGVQVVAAPVGTVELNLLPDVDLRERTSFASTVTISAAHPFGDATVTEPIAPSPRGSGLEIKDPFGAINAALQVLLAEASPAEFIIVEIEGSNYYVQFAKKSGTDHLHAEAVGPEYLTESEQLSAHQMATVQAIGWQPPSATYAGNHWLDCNPAEAGVLDRLVRMSLDTLFGVYKSDGVLSIMSALPDEDLQKAVEQLRPGVLQRRANNEARNARPGSTMSKPPKCRAASGRERRHEVAVQRRGRSHCIRNRWRSSRRHQLVR